jgi:hypothetical protein
MGNYQRSAYRFTLPIILMALLILTVSCSFSGSAVNVKPTEQPAQTPVPTSEVQVSTQSAAAEKTAQPIPQGLEPEVLPEALATVIPQGNETELPEQPQRTNLSDQLTPEGPWLLINSQSGLWATNSDGSGLTQLTNIPVIAPDDISIAANFNGKTVAFIGGDEDGYHNLKLYLLTLPDATLKVITPLTNKYTEPGNESFLDARMEAIRAITEYNPFAWSPDGKQLAFIGVLNGPSADLYIYSLETGTILRLSDGPSQGYNPVWTPDGQYVIHFGANSFGTGAGHAMVGGWAAKVDGSSMITLFSGGNNPELFKGWFDEDTYLASTWSPACGEQNLRLVDYKTGKKTSLVGNCFGTAAANGMEMAVVAGEDGDPPRGVFRIGPGSLDKAQLSTEPAFWIGALPMAGEILVRQDSGMTVYALDGSAIAKSPNVSCQNNMTLASYGMIYAWACAGETGDLGVWLNGPGLDENHLFTKSAHSPAWAPDNTLLFFNDDMLYRKFFTHYEPEPVTKVPSGIYGTAWVNFH